MKKDFSFLHISDLHLSNQPSLLRTERELKEKIINLYLMSLEEAVSYVTTNDLDALLIAGDLFESERVDPEIMKKTFEILSIAGEIPVFIAPGNHDLYSSVYAEGPLKFFNIQLPDNVHVFNTQDFSYVELEGVHVYGCACMVPEYNPFNSTVEGRDGWINLAICHGSLIKYLPEDKEAWLPFSEEDLLNSGFDYIALGHYHAYREIRDSTGALRAAYPGSLVPVTMKDKGQRGGLHVRITREGESKRVTSEFVRLGQIGLEEISLNLPPETNIKELSEMLMERLSGYDDSPRTVFILNLSGFGFPHVEEITEEVGGHCLHLHIRRENLFSTDLEDILSRYSEKSTLGMFARRMLEEIENSQGAERRLLVNALAYGLDALMGRQIGPRYED